MQHHKTDQAKIKPQKQKNAKREKRPPKKITATYLHNSGLYYLERFAASKKHFISVMSRKVKRSCMHHKEQDYDECITMVDELANKFEKSGLLNDELLTEGLVNSLRRKGKSKKAILNKLRQKGLDQDSVLNALSTHDQNKYEDSDLAEKLSAIKLARKKKIGPFNIKEEQDIKKSLGIFARAGFSYDISYSTLGMDIEEAEDMLYEHTSL